MGILVDMKTGEFVMNDDIGNLLEYVNALNELGIPHNFVVYPHDDAYAEVA